MYYIKKVLQNYWCSSSIACQEKRAVWILRISTFNEKNALYLPIITTLQSFFWCQWSRINPISDKTIWHISSIQNSRFKLKKIPVFSKPVSIFYLYLDITSQIFWDQFSSPEINVVFKYLRQFLAPRFGAAPLSISCNID